MAKSKVESKQKRHHSNAGPSLKETQPSKESCCLRYRKEFLALFVGSVMLVCAGVAVAVVFRTINPPPDFFGPGAQTLEITMEEVARHDRPSDDCWVIYYGEVYDMTEYAKRHPGGARIITNLCGGDGTVAYENYHSKDLMRTVVGTKVGTLVADSIIAARPSPTRAPLGGSAINNGNGNNNPCPDGMTMTKLVTWRELEQHNTPDDAWVVYDGMVYDMTTYAKRHPGGARIITNLAGKDGTIAYKRYHRLSLLKTVAHTKIGPLEGSNNDSECINDDADYVAMEDAYGSSEDSDSEDSDD